MHKLDVCRRAVSVRLSVRPSYSCILSRSRPNHILKLFSPSDSHTTLAFSYQTLWQYSDGDPPNGGAECRWCMKHRDFRPISRFISEMIQDRIIVMRRGNCTQAFQWCHLQWPWATSNPDFKERHYLMLTISETVWNTVVMNSFIQLVQFNIR